MRILVTCIPQAGHVNPLLPLITEFVRRDAEVLVASGPYAQVPAERAGAAFSTVGPDIDRWFQALGARTYGSPGDGLPPDRVLHYFAPRLFGEVALADTIDPLLAVAREFTPDLIVHDPLMFAGPLVAEVLGAPSVNFQVGALPELDVVRLVNDAVTPAWRKLGQQTPQWAGLYRDRTAAICPPSLDPHTPPAGSLLRVRPTPAPTRPAAPTQPPLVYVTFGTLWASSDLLDTVLRALADLPIRVVATTGELDPSGLHAVPRNAEVHRFIPQAELLPDATAVVHHAGGGTMFAALAHGLPQVALPQAADNFVNGQLLEDCGAGITIPPDAITADRVADAVREVLAAPDYRHAADAIARELDEMPTVEALVHQLL